MFGRRISTKRGGRDDGERPFWISFADMMTALMVLFMLVMSVALLSVTKTVTEAQRKVAARDQAIDQLMVKIEGVAKDYPGVTVDHSKHTIDFGDKARFGTGRYDLQPGQEQLLRSFVPKVLAISRDPLGQRWMKQIVVEGFTDQRGTYLYNLNLSLERSQRVLCVLTARPAPPEAPMAQGDLDQIRKLFLVGGYSFNSSKESDEASRRIELRLEFFGVDEKRPNTRADLTSAPGVCAI